MGLLANIKIKHFLIIGLLGAVLLLNYYRNKYREEKKDHEFTANNYQNALTIDSLKVAVFKVKSKNDFEQIVNQNKDLKTLYNKSETEKRRLKGLVFTKQTYIDSIEQKRYVNNLIENIRRDIPAKQDWQTETECSEIGGYVEYKRDSLSVSVTKQKFNNAILLEREKGKRKPVKWLLGLRIGKRQSDNYHTSSKCGDVKIQVIDKVN